jgi:hypothetical protein
MDKDDLTWYLHKGNTNYGPYTWEELCRNRIEPTDLVWNDTMPDWVGADQVPGLPLRVVPDLPFKQEKPVVQSYLAWSILVTLLFCWPLGIPAIVYSTQVNSKLARGDFDGAVKASKKARTFCWISFGLGLVANAIFLMAYYTGNYGW